jgi:UDP-N-acetylmuramoyl-L-alanyl-D-glutamate--2,6-diaminopimelate ligase
MRPTKTTRKSLLELANFLGIPAAHEGTFSGVTSNTAYIEPGDLFIALAGAKTHGASMAREAAAKGAVAVLTDQAGVKLVDGAIPVIFVTDPKEVSADIASWFYDRPFASMVSVGITGTNGKTTVASLLFQLWQKQNRKPGMIGTTGIVIGDDQFPTKFTTPEGTELQAIAATMKEESVTHCVMEVSSHALVQRRMFGTHFVVSGFTNLSQDHLDFHGSMTAYFEAKSALFTSEYTDYAIINIDTEWGAQLATQVHVPVESLSRENVKADWHYSSIARGGKGYDLAIRGVGGILIEGHLSLLGLHNLDNALMAVALGVKSGLDPLAIGRDLSGLVGAPGRLESVSVGQPFTALVDFAHTPDAVENVLRAVREITSGRVIAVLGCGGDRDASKRPLMGAALVAGSDLAIFTSDNPRSEDPAKILTQMVADREPSDSLVIESDRRGAIAVAVSEAQAGDTVVILGKGHETGQEVAGVKYPFDDRSELVRAIKEFS